MRLQLQCRCQRCLSAAAHRRCHVQAAKEALVLLLRWVVMTHCKVLLWVVIMMMMTHYRALFRVMMMTHYKVLL